MGWQWHQLDHMQIICTSLQTDNHVSTSYHSVFTGQTPFLPPKRPNQQRQSTEGITIIIIIIIIIYKSGTYPSGYKKIYTYYIAKI